ncbi:hypothetical protein ACH5RR_025836 [Cinchona calisaya]|uniref:Uncharacterized protein n=1 Tax=Cinchona calisaya TaxID=153742 RepID=A0ABD2Z0T3_9GENT
MASLAALQPPLLYAPKSFADVISISTKSASIIKEATIFCDIPSTLKHQPTLENSKENAMLQNPSATEKDSDSITLEIPTTIAQNPNTHVPDLQSTKGVEASTKFFDSTILPHADEHGNVPHEDSESLQQPNPCMKTQLTSAKP